MKIRINKRNIDLSPELKKYIESRVALAFGRFSDRTRLVLVSFSKVEPVGGAPATCCHIEVTLNKTVSVEAADANAFAAVNRALGHAARRITRAVDQEAASDA